MTAAPPRREDRQPSGAGPDEPPRRLGISLVQVIAAALAAATATIAASFLGVAGTVVGAALASVISVTGTAVYSQSLRHTGHRVRQRVPRPGGTAQRPVRPPADRPPLQPPGGRSPLDRPTLQGGGFPDPTYYGRRRGVPEPGVPEPGVPRPGAPAGPDGPGPAGSARTLWRRLAVATVAVFAVVLAVVTGVELLAGRPISDLVRGRNGTGTTLFGTHHARHTPGKSPPPQRPTGPSGPAAPSGSQTSRSAGTSPAPRTTHPPKASVARSSATSPLTPSSTAAPSTSSASTPSPTPSATSSSATAGSARSQTAAP